MDNGKEWRRKGMGRRKADLSIRKCGCRESSIGM